MINQSEFQERLQFFKYPSELTVKDFASTDYLKYLEKENLMAPLHRLKEPLAILVVGATNVGKTAVIKHLFIDEMGRQRYGKFFEENVRPKDEPDVTRHISRLPFGSDPENPSQGIVIYDTPGLASDEDHVDRIARAALGMEVTQWDQEEWEVEIEDEKGIEIIEVLGSREAPHTYYKKHPDGRLVKDSKGRPIVKKEVMETKIKRRKELREVECHIYHIPEALHSPAEFEVKWVPVAEVPKIVNDRTLTCLYVVNSADNTLAPDTLRKHVAELKEIFEGNVVFAKTFRDGFETWSDRKIDERLADLDDILGADAVWVNGSTGDGVDGLSMQLMAKNGFGGSMGKHLNVEFKCRRLFSACQQIPGVIIPALFSRAVKDNAFLSEALAKDVDRELSDILSFLTYFFIHVIYTVDPEKDPHIETFHENVKQFTAELKDSVIDDKPVALRRALRGFWEKLGSLFGWDDWRTTYRIVQELARTPESLARLYYWVYTVIHERERKEKASVIVPEKVPEVVGIEWFVEAFQPYEDLLGSDADDAAWKFYQAIGTDTLTNFFQIHHPEVMPVHKPTHLAKDEAEESTE